MSCDSRRTESMLKIPKLGIISKCSRVVAAKWAVHKICTSGAGSSNFNQRSPNLPSITTKPARLLTRLSTKVKQPTSSLALQGFWPLINLLKSRNSKNCSWLTSTNSHFPQANLWLKILFQTGSFLRHPKEWLVRWYRSTHWVQTPRGCQRTPTKPLSDQTSWLIDTRSAKHTHRKAINKPKRVHYRVQCRHLILWCRRPANPRTQACCIPSFSTDSGKRSWSRGSWTTKKWSWLAATLSGKRQARSSSNRSQTRIVRRAACTIALVSLARLCRRRSCSVRIWPKLRPSRSNRGPPLPCPTE